MKINIPKTLNNFKLGPNDYNFVNRVFKNGINTYISRIKQYEFCGKQKVLDAGCGFGQWSLSLAHLNKEVYSCDADQLRVNFSQSMFRELGVENIITKQSVIDCLPYPNDYFNVVFCYGVIFLTSWKKSLYELVRVLKPGGKIYINANGLGWYKFLWYSNYNQVEDYSPRKVAAEAWMNTYKYQTNLPLKFPTQLIIEPEELMKELKALKIKKIKMDGEGLLNNPKNKKVFFKKNYYGDIGVYEVIGEK